MNEIPKFVATPHDDDEFWCIETGDTAEDALMNLKVSSLFSSYCSDSEADRVTIYVHKCVRPEDSDWPEEERDPEWEWVAGDIVLIVEVEPKLDEVRGNLDSEVESCV